MDRTTTNRLEDDAARLLGGQQQEERHFDVFVCFWPENWDGGRSAQPVPIVRRVSPRPRVVPLNTLAISENQGGGHEQALLQRYELQGISRRYSDEDLRGDFWLVLDPGTEVTPDNAGNFRPRYKPMGSPNAAQDSWTLSLVEER